MVIPCYNQGEYLADAIDSVLRQTLAAREIIVVDDGSTDATHDIAAGYPEVIYVHQHNQGLATARNTGIDAAKGEYLVFLDADDCLIPDALQIGYELLLLYPECGFVSGHHSYINHDGVMTTIPPQEPMAAAEPYVALLMNNYIGMHATVMYRQCIFESVGKFNPALPACEDYDLYLRVARQFPTARHSRVIAEYRQHDANMSRDVILMMNSVLSVLKAQRCHVRDKPERLNAYRTGIRNWMKYYGRIVVSELGEDFRNRKWRKAWDRLEKVIRNCPSWIGALLR